MKVIWKLCEECRIYIYPPAGKEVRAFITRKKKPAKKGGTLVVTMHKENCPEWGGEENDEVRHGRDGHQAPSTDAGRMGERGVDSDLNSSRPASGSKGRSDLRKASGRKAPGSGLSALPSEWSPGVDH